MSVTKACMGHGTSKHCKYCHDAGLIEYGYGWPGFGDRFKAPEETVA